MTPWIQELRRPVVQVAAVLEWPCDARRGMPCPACRAEYRDARRGAAGLTRDGYGWACHRCGAEGDAADLAAYRLHGARVRALSPEQRRALRGWSQEMQLSTGRWSPAQIPALTPIPLPEGAVPVTDVGPSEDELGALWLASRAVCADGEVAHYCERRGWAAETLMVLDIARATPRREAYVWPSWWPPGRARTWRLIARLWSPAGRLVGLHGRAVRPTAEVDGKPLPKALSHRGMAGAGWMANSPALEWMRGRNRPPIVAVAEGVTDWIALSCWAYGKGGPWRGLPVIGGISGSFRSARDLPVQGVRLLVATHADTAGDRYAEEINRAAGSVADVCRVRLEALNG